LSDFYIWLNLLRKEDRHFFLHLRMDDRHFGYEQKLPSFLKNTDPNGYVTDGRPPVVRPSVRRRSVSVCSSLSLSPFLRESSPRLKSGSSTLSSLFFPGLLGQLLQIRIANICLKRLADFQFVWRCFLGSTCAEEFPFYLLRSSYCRSFVPRNLQFVFQNVLRAARFPLCTYWSLLVWRRKLILDRERKSSCRAKDQR
jgi:hypothetical protein